MAIFEIDYLKPTFKSSKPYEQKTHHVIAEGYKEAVDMFIMNMKAVNMPKLEILMIRKLRKDV